MSVSKSIVTRWAEAATPPPELTVSQWADAERFLPETSSTRGGRWVTARTPYLRGIMDAVHEPGIKTLILMKCAQVGGSEVLHNILGYNMQHDPSPMLFVHPTISVAEEWSKERLADMIRTTPALRQVVRDKRGAGGDGESTLALKMFPGGFLALGGANTPNTFARRAVRVAIGDDVDRFPAIVGEEGDPVELLADRTTTFYDSLVSFVSTPTLKGGRIDNLYGRSDQRRFHITCPECGLVDWITWSDPKHFRVVFDERDPETARIECPSTDAGGCGYRIDEAERRILIEESCRETTGWIATATASEAGLIGFHLPAMVSTLGDVTLPRLVERWLAARGRGNAALRAFINTRLAEPWEERVTKIEPHTLLERRERYGAEGVEVPERAVVLTAGVDVQADRFEIKVMAWAPGDERWLIDYRIIYGKPDNAETHEALFDALSRTYRHATGAQLRIYATCIDSGYATDDVYDIVLKYQQRIRIYCTKGYADKAGEPIVGRPSDKRRGKTGRPVRLYPINVDDAKKNTLDCITVTEPGPGAIHWPIHLDIVDEEYFSGLCAEHSEPRRNKAGIVTHTVWVKDRERNEPLDLAVLCLAALRITKPNLPKHRERLAGSSNQMTAAPALGQPPLENTERPQQPKKKWIPNRRPGGWLKRGR